MSRNFIRIDNYLANRHSSLIYGSSEFADAVHEAQVKKQNTDSSPPPSPYSYKLEGETSISPAHTVRLKPPFRTSPNSLTLADNNVNGGTTSFLSHMIGSLKLPESRNTVLSPSNRIESKNIWLSSQQIWLLACAFLGFMLANVWITRNALSLNYPTMSDLMLHTKTNTELMIRADESSAVKDTLSDNVFNEVEIQKYTLQPGDFLINLAKEFNISVDTLVSWNNIKDARRIRAGDEFIIPNRSGILHSVKRGETIDGLAQKYNIKTISILDANNLPSNVIAPGTKLFLPEAKMDKFQLDIVLGNVFLAPTRGYISSGYGYRISPITGVRMFHAAIDIANKEGTPILAATYGTVSYVMQNNPTYGKMVVIAHPGGFKTLYAHLKNIYVRTGERVARGESIGTMGNTGLSTGPHLHFAVIHNGRSLNPLIYVRIRR